MNYKEVKKLIDKHGLKAGLKREVSLFTSSCVLTSYCALMKNDFGMSYGSMAWIHTDNNNCSIVNTDFVSKEIEKIIENGNLILILNKANTLYQEFYKDYKKNEKLSREKSFRFLEFILKNYPRYLLSLGFHNALMRYIDNDLNKKGLNQINIYKLGKERNEVGKLYYLIESVLKDYTNLLGKDFLLFMTFDEVNSFLKSKTLSQKMMSEIEKRRFSSFCLYNPETKIIGVISEKKTVKKINAQLFETKHLDTEIIKGISAYPGIVKGKVYILDEKNLSKHFNEGSILVAFHTNPHYINLIKRSSAIVTNEGGVTSHAAIIARELNKPCIIGTKIATKVLRDGDLIEVDANKGIVKIIDKNL